MHEFDDNVAVVATTVARITVSGKITPAEVAGSSWGSVGVPAGRVRDGSSGPRASSNFPLTASLLKRPFASAANNEFPNTNIENVTNVRVKKRAAVYNTQL